MKENKYFVRIDYVPDSDKKRSLNSKINGNLVEIKDLQFSEIVQAILMQEDNTLFVISEENSFPKGDSFNLYIGNEMAEIKKVGTYRDGGSKKIFYLLDGQEGELFIPIRKEKAPVNNYNDKESNLERIL